MSTIVVHNPRCHLPSRCHVERPCNHVLVPQRPPRERPSARRPPAPCRRHHPRSRPRLIASAPVTGVRDLSPLRPKAWRTHLSGCTCILPPLHPRFACRACLFWSGRGRPCTQCSRARLVPSGQVAGRRNSLEFSWVFSLSVEAWIHFGWPSDSHH